jgi:hypothetical protein
MSPSPIRPRQSCSCEGFTRAEMLRRGAAQAGRGLPAIEPGMPIPAGTGLSRRGFLLASAGLALSVYGAGRLLDPAAFEEGIARAAEVPDQPILVSVYLQGGIDAMSVLYPAGDPLYTKYRPVLALPEDAGPVFTEDPRLHWHPQAAPLAQLHEEGKMSVLPAVGYTDPDQSHFTSRHYWEVGATQADLLTGWMGRAWTRRCSRRSRPRACRSRRSTPPPPIPSMPREYGDRPRRSCTTTSTRSGAWELARATRHSNSRVRPR